MQLQFEFEYVTFHPNELFVSLNYDELDPDAALLFMKLINIGKVLNTISFMLWDCVFIRC